MKNAQQATPLTASADDTIVVTREPAPPVPESVRDQLHRMSPRHFLRWNNEHTKVGYAPGGTPVYEGRWEIWIELKQVQGASNKITGLDTYLPEHGCWARKLQTYTHEDGSYAPADQRLIVGLHMADTWGSGDPYEDLVRRPRREREQAQIDRFDDAAQAAVSANKRAGAPHVTKTRELD